MASYRDRVEDLRAALREFVGERRPVLVAALLGATAAAVVALVAVGSRPDPAAPLPRAIRVTTTTAPPPPIVVHVSGAVVRPGLVELSDGARVADAVRAAGGVRPPVDLAGVNLAQVVTDGARIHVPEPGEVGAGAVPAGVVDGGEDAGAFPLDLNRATATDLERLPGVGPSIAAAIVTHRSRVGRFGTVEELLDVPGIGPAKFAAIRSAVRV